MSKKENDIFKKNLEDVKPLKKSNKLSRPVPEISKKHLQKYKAPNSIKEANTPTEEKQSHTHALKVEKTNINKKLKRGKILVDRRVDLHGETLDSAEKIFQDTVFECFSKNKRCILFITGKGVGRTKYSEYSQNSLYFGKIRNNFLNWTQKTNIESKILSVEIANQQHGGDGAFFVYLRKNKN